MGNVKAFIRRLNGGSGVKKVAWSDQDIARWREIYGVTEKEAAGAIEQAARTRRSRSKSASSQLIVSFRPSGLSPPRMARLIGTTTSFRLLASGWTSSARTRSGIGSTITASQSGSVPKHYKERQTQVHVGTWHRHLRTPRLDGAEGFSRGPNPGLLYRLFATALGLQQEPRWSGFPRNHADRDFCMQPARLSRRGS